MSSLSYISTLSFIYFKKYTIKLNSRNTIFGYSRNKLEFYRSKFNWVAWKVILYLWSLKMDKHQLPKRERMWTMAWNEKLQRKRSWCCNWRIHKKIARARGRWLDSNRGDWETEGQQLAGFTSRSSSARTPPFRSLRVGWASSEPSHMCLRLQTIGQMWAFALII